jgi:DNA-binding NtrC family response regulator
MTPLNLLVLRKDDAQRAELLAILQGAGHHTVAVENAAFAAEAIGAQFDTMVLDLTWPGLDLQSLRRALAPEENAEPGSLAAAECRHLALVLRYTSGNKRKAAHLLGISRSTLLNKVRKYGLDRAETGTR